MLLISLILRVIFIKADLKRGVGIKRRNTNAESPISNVKGK
jgi:hypothetical protein